MDFISLKQAVATQRKPTQASFVVTSPDQPRNRRVWAFLLHLIMFQSLPRAEPLRTQRDKLCGDLGVIISVWLVKYLGQLEICIKKNVFSYLPPTQWQGSSEKILKYDFFFFCPIALKDMLPNI